MKHATSCTAFQALPLRLLDHLRQSLHDHHYSQRTEETYIYWVTRYILFHGMRHPVNMGAGEIREFLWHLVNEHKVAGTKYIQALCALLFLYKKLLKIDVGWIDSSEPSPASAKNAATFAGRQLEMPLPQWKNEAWHPPRSCRLQ